jgi:hypothetical protein
MFPAILAEEVFSLGQAEACPAMSFVGDVTPDGRLERHEIMLTTVSATRLSYSDVDALLSGDGEGIKPAKDNAELLKLLQVCPRDEISIQRGLYFVAPLVIDDGPASVRCALISSGRGVFVADRRLSLSVCRSWTKWVVLVIVTGSGTTALRFQL